MSIDPKAARIVRHQGDTYDFVANLQQLGIAFPGTIAQANLAVAGEIPPGSSGLDIDVTVNSPPSSSITFPIGPTEAALPVGEYIAQVQIIEDNTDGGAIYTTPAFFWEIKAQLKT